LGGGLGCGMGAESELYRRGDGRGRGAGSVGVWGGDGGGIGAGSELDRRRAPGIPTGGFNPPARAAAREGACGSALSLAGLPLSGEAGKVPAGPAREAGRTMRMRIQSRKPAVTPEALFIARDRARFGSIARGGCPPP
jgi:hypothetical protein